jgi:hypothetical protein
MKPICIDLCCGSGGWAAGFIAEGYQVVGYDIVDQPKYPGRFVMRDVRGLDGRDFRITTVIVASPPCEQFSRHDQPWTRKRNPPPPDTSIWESCARIALECGAPIVLENVRGAQSFMGRAKWHVGPYYLWGDVPALMPKIRELGIYRDKQSRSSSARLERARVPFELARHIARVFRPEGGDIRYDQQQQRRSAAAAGRRGDG